MSLKHILKLSALLPRLEAKLQESVCQNLKDAGVEPEAAEIKRVESKLQTAEPGDGATIQIYASTRDMDRDNEILIPKGCDLSQYKLSPVILEGHNYGRPPIGKATSVSRDDYGVKMKIQFAPTDDGEKYSQLARFMKLQASVGFVPTDAIDSAHADWDGTLKQLAADWPEFGKVRKSVKRIIRKWTMLETSIVPVPCNPHAIQEQLAKAVADGKIKEDEAKLIVKSFADADKPQVDQEIIDFLNLLESTEPYVGQKPFPNEHAARIVAPGKFDEFRRRNNAGGSGIHFIFGITRNPRTSELQAIRFDRTKFTVAQARAWLKEHDHKPLLFEPATGKATKISQATRYAPQVRLVSRADDIADIVQRALQNKLDMAKGRV
jgi:hypothetical protein